MKTALISTLLSLLICVICNATPISGDIWGALTAEGSPYEVIGDLHVPQCSTLVIEAGCYFDFQGYYHLEVDTSAVLQIQGNHTDSVIFTSQDTIICWEGINYLSENDGSELNYCIIEWAKDLENPNDYHGILGGAVYINNSNINIFNCLIRFNRIYSEGDGCEGAGIYCNNSTLALTDCVIADNLSYEGFAGGIMSDNSVITVNNCEILDNHASFSSSGIFCNNSISVLAGNLISGNITHYVLGGEDSGAILIYGGETLVENNKIVDNRSGNSGGGIRLSEVSATLKNNYIANNNALEWGGGISVNMCPNPILTNNIISNNQAFTNVGGGICLWECEDVIFNNNTIYGNSGQIGGGVYINNDSSLTLTNNIIFNNFAYEGQQLYSADSNLIVQYSCIQYGWPGEGNIDTNPMFVEPSHWDFHLRWDNYPSDDDTKSPCIDAGAPWSPLDPDSTCADIGALPFDQLVGIDDDFNDRLPRHIMLYQNYPNPFNASTLIRYELPRQSQVTIDIYDILGRKVQTLQDGLQPAGEYQLNWLAENLSSGVYLYKIQAGDYNESRRMTLVK